MLGFSSKSMYSVAAMFELAQHFGKDAVQINEIAKVQKIPADYLRHLLIALKRSKLVESVRGANGGYVLAKHPSKITVLEILEGADGEMKLMRAKISDQTLFNYWSGRQSELDKIFQTTLEELVNEKKKREENITFHI